MVNNIFLRAATVATIGAVGVSGTLPGTSTEASTIELTDIKGHPYEQAIKALVNKGMINGYPDKTFKPNRALTRYDITLIIGRYLVSLGYTFPGDYATKMRFKDLNKNSDRVLLQYAALLADEGILYGDLGNRLNAYEPLTREQLALILSRAFTVIDDFNYTSYVQEQQFLKEYLDTQNLGTSSQRAIDVLDYYDIVNGDYFKPKETATRGQFASMMYGMMQIKGSGAATSAQILRTTALSPTRVKITLTDQSVHEVRLDEPLVENVATPIQVTLNGRTYNTTVTYRVDQVKVVNVENINSGQFVIHFNQEVDLANTYHGNSDLSKFFTLKNSAGTTIRLQKGELSDDGKSFKITVEDKTALRGTFKLKIDGVHGVTGIALPTFEDSYYFVADTTKPEIVGIEQVTKDIVKVKFSEPVYTTTNTITYKYGKDNVTGVVAKYHDVNWTSNKNATEIEFNLSNARVISKLPANAKIDVSISGLQDLAGNKFATNPLSFSIKKGGTDKDNVAPKLQTVEQIGAKQFKLTFNEPMSLIYAYQIVLESDINEYIVEDVTRVESDKHSFIVTVDEFLEGRVTVKSHNSYKVEDETGTKGTFEKTVDFYYNSAPAKVLQTRVVRENNLEYLFVEFDQNVEIHSNASALLTGQYNWGGKNYPMYAPEAASVYPVIGDRKTIKIPLYELVKNYDRQGAKYNVDLTFENVFNEYHEQVENTHVSFARNTDYNYNSEKLELLSVHTSRTDCNITDNSIMMLTFNYPVDEKLATDLYNYKLFDYDINWKEIEMKIKTVRVNPSNPYQVELTLDQTVTRPVSPFLYVWNLRGAGSIREMDPYYERVYLNENVAPKYKGYEVVNNRQMKLTFSEALANIQEDAFYVTNTAGEKLAVTAKVDPTNSSKIVLTFGQDLVRSSKISVKLQSNRALYDLYNNKGTFADLEISLPSSFPTN